MAPEDNDPALDWPLARRTPGREVWYGLVGPADGSRAFWYRYTLLSTDAGHQEGRVWAALTDEDGASFASRALPMEEVWPSARPFSLSVGDAELTSESARGALSTADGETLSWSLSHDPDPYSFTPLRSQRLTDLLSTVAGTGKHWSANESVRTSGTVTVGDRTVEFEDAPGHQGHTLGSSPPESWTWVQCNGFGDESVSLEALDLDGTLSVLLRRDGEVHALNRLHHVVDPRRNRTERDEVGHWRFAARGEGVELTATVEADADHWQRVAYKAPDETLRYNAHCSVSSVTLEYAVDGGESRTLTSDAGRAEWVSVEPPIAGTYLPDWDSEPRYES